MNQTSTPSLLGSLLPSTPDTARLTGARGELVPRLLAVVIDAIPSVVISVLFMVIGFIPVLGVVASPLNALFQLVYFFGFIPWTVSTYGASLGKKAMKLRVCPLGAPLQRIPFVPALLRQFGNFFFLNLIVLAIKGEERVSLSDLLAKTEVVQVQD
ncbi:MAG: hypothetical protein H6Q00_326 [Holophagaceae bacterium]|nr:hypothetical protein [Holophagaceae bacterium]